MSNQLPTVPDLVRNSVAIRLKDVSAEFPDFSFKHSQMVEEMIRGYLEANGIEKSDDEIENEASRVELEMPYITDKMKASSVITTVKRFVLKQIGRDCKVSVKNDIDEGAIVVSVHVYYNNVVEHVKHKRKSKSKVFADTLIGQIESWQPDITNMKEGDLQAAQEFLRQLREFIRDLQNSTNC